MYRKRRLVTVHLTLFFLMLFAIPLGWPRATTLQGLVHNVDNGLVYSNIQAAIDAPETLAGHTILVSAGMYEENVKLTKPISLVGENRSNTVIVANRTGSTVSIWASNSKISGFSIRGGTSGIALRNVKNCTISDNDVKGNTYGVVLACSGGNILRQNVIAGNSYNFHVSGRLLPNFLNDVDASNTVDGKPIYYWVNKKNGQIPLDAGYVAVVNSTGVLVSKLSLARNGQGILFAFVTNSMIEHVETRNNYDGMLITDCEECTLTGNEADNNDNYGMELVRLADCHITQNKARNNGGTSYGIRLSESLNVSMVGNKACGNTYGIVVQFSEACLISQNNVSYNNGMGIWPKFCERCTFTQNHACDNGFYGIEPEDSKECIFSQNYISNNGLYGIWLLGALDTCNSHIVKKNHIEENKVGIGLTNSSFNLIYHNNFFNNEHQAGTGDSEGNLWNSSFEGNYWSDYVGVDEDHDGIGDTSYFIDESNTDKNPLMGMFTSLKTSQGHQIPVISNSTITDLEIFEFNSTIRIHVSNVSIARPLGFCRISLPKELASPPFSFFIDDEMSEIIQLNENVHDNGTHRWIYVAYQYTAYKIDLTLIILISSLSAAIIVAAVVYIKKKQN